MNIQQQVVKKILQEEPLHGEDEFGGYLVVKNNEVVDVIFDMKFQSGGYVELGIRNVFKLIPKEDIPFVRGWFHRHPITGLSDRDRRTIFRLTKFWGECYTIVLQSNRKLLGLKTVGGKTFFRNYKVKISTIIQTDTWEVNIDEFIPKPE